MRVYIHPLTCYLSCSLYIEHTAWLFYSPLVTSDCVRHTGAAAGMVLVWTPTRLASRPQDQGLGLILFECFVGVGGSRRGR
jgi:hypothetical protein